ncbi:MAG: DNA internalization-related competence protein ComEC/Rec2 [Woeseiaceae bacterium]|nr:DNA internalization-related competence protein ComEC/Rec2 [Woeseiaceae bacterium]
MNKACLYLLAGVYAPQLSSFASHSDLFLLAVFAVVAGLIIGRALPVVLFCTGYGLFVLAAGQVIEARIPAEFVGDSIMTEVRVIDFPQVHGPTVSMMGEVRDNPWVSGRIRISWYEPDAEIHLGDVWRLELRLRRPRGTANPGVFDYETWLFRERVAATAYVVDSQRNALIRSGDLGPINRLRRRVVERTVAVVTEPERAAVLSAISVGARHLVVREQWDRYASTGTTHLMAISGLHVGMVAAAGYFLAAVISGIFIRGSNHHRTSTVVALCFAIAYSVVSGLAVPAQRSALMIGLVALAVLRYRQVPAFTVIATASVLISASSPLATMAPGFKLSFLAVLVLVWMARRLVPVQSGSLLSVPLRASRQLGGMQLMLLFGLMPFTVLIFGRISLAAPLVNMLAVPVFSLTTVPLTLCGLLLDGPLHNAGDHLLRLASASLGLVEWAIEYAAQLPVASVSPPAIAGWSLALLFLPLAWVFCPPGWPGRNVAWIAALAVILYQPSRPSQGCAIVDVLDVGQGLAVSIATRSSTLLFDTGPAFRGGGDAAESVVLPFLAGRGVNRLDELVVSHADLDHAGGVSSLVHALPVGTLRIGEVIDDPAVARRCDAGESWTVDGIDFEFLYPDAKSNVSGNNASCVLQVSAGSHRLLLTGDIERAAEAELLRSGTLQDVDVVIVPHHGSRTSSSPSFVRALHPDLAIISAGFGNRWGLPHVEVVERWRASGAEVLTTAASGAISLRLCRQGGIVALTRQRVRQRRIWHE